jgi:hypothetical protein
MTLNVTLINNNKHQQQQPLPSGNDNEQCLMDRWPLLVPLFSFELFTSELFFKEEWSLLDLNLGLE